MTNTEVCNQAHDDAQTLLDNGATPEHALTAAEACAMMHDLTGAAAELYVSRFKGHCINVMCGTAGR